jgi:FlgD Ig-like domain
MIGNRFVLVLFSALLMRLFVPGSAHGGRDFVFPGYNIQDHIDMAASGDTVSFYPGTYVITAGEALTLKNGVTLLGDPVDKPVFEAHPLVDDNYAILTASATNWSATGSSTIIENIVFSINSSDGTMTGIQFVDAQGYNYNGSIVRGCEFDEGFVMAIDIQDNVDNFVGMGPWIDNNTISGALIGIQIIGTGGGYSGALITNNHITADENGSQSNKGISIVNAVATIEGNTISNISGNFHAGIYMYFNDRVSRMSGVDLTAYIRDNHVDTSGKGAWIKGTVDPPVVIDNNTLVDNGINLYLDIVESTKKSSAIFIRDNIFDPDDTFEVINSADIDARNNDWGPAVTAEMDACPDYLNCNISAIIDGHDIPGRGLVDFSGYLNSNLSGVEHEVPASSKPALACNPNPFNPSTRISYSLAETGRAVLSVYDVGGRLVKTLVDAHLDAGLRTVAWRGVDEAGNRVASGTYFLRLETGKEIRTRKVMLAK